MALGAGDIPNRWRELHGSESWAGLLDPLDNDLRASVIAYGELAEATYDGFNADDKYSVAPGTCMYSHAGLLAASGVSHPEYYTVTKFLYATCNFPPWSESESSSKVQSWIGYVAVATDEGVAALGRRDIVVTWRGSVKVAEFFEDADTWFAPAEKVLGKFKNRFQNAKVHRGFLSMYTAEEIWTLGEETDIVKSARDQTIEEVRWLMNVHKDEETSITVTGHSMGASLATLNAVDMVAHGVNVSPSKQQTCPVTAILFVSPRAGNNDFKHAFASFAELRALGVINKYDPVPKFPQGYVHVTTATLHIDTSRSPYLRPGDMLTCHVLECYLHGLTIGHGANGDLELVVDRDLALVNKSTNALKEGYQVPANWWVFNYKGTVKGVVGRWKLDKLPTDE